MMFGSVLKIYEVELDKEIMSFMCEGLWEVEFLNGFGKFIFER